MFGLRFARQFEEVQLFAGRSFKHALFEIGGTNSQRQRDSQAGQRAVAFAGALQHWDLSWFGVTDHHVLHVEAEGYRSALTVRRDEDDFLPGCRNDSAADGDGPTPKPSHAEHEGIFRSKSVEDQERLFARHIRNPTG
jgi:hypothetical protein